jgi:Nif-specific regulatory protein
VRKIAEPASAANGNGVVKPNHSENDLNQQDSTEHQRLVDAMEGSGWVQAKAARKLGLTPRQMGYALRKHNIEIKRL